MVMCHIRYPLHFRNARMSMFQLIHSSEARYSRLTTYHPGIVPASRWTRTRITGYTVDYPPKLFRMEYFLQMIYYHFKIISFEHSCLREITDLRHMSTQLSRIFMVSFFKTSHLLFHKSLIQINFLHPIMVVDIYR